MQKKSTTTFEVIDANRDWETKAGNDYCHLMIDFISSLGFDVQNQYPDGKALFDHILIDGVEAFLYTDSASCMGQNAYSKVRKPRQNRFIGISGTGTWHNTGLIRIPINKEVDKDKLIKKISELIKRKSDGAKQLKDLKESEETLALKIRDHIQSDAILRDAMTSLRIQKGESLIAGEFGGVSFIIETWKFKLFSPPEIPFSTLEQILDAPRFALTVSTNALKYINSITVLGNPLTESEIELTKSMNHYPTLK